MQTHRQRRKSLMCEESAQWSQSCNLCSNCQVSRPCRDPRFLTIIPKSKPIPNLHGGFQFVNRLKCSQVLESHCMSLHTSQKLPFAREWRILSQDASPGELKTCYKCSNLRSEIIHLDMKPRRMIWYWIVLHSTNLQKQKGYHFTFGKMLFTGDQEMISWKTNKTVLSKNQLPHFKSWKTPLCGDRDWTNALSETKQIIDKQFCYFFRCVTSTFSCPQAVPSIHPFSSEDHGVFSLLRTVDFLKLMLEFQLQSTLFNQNSKKVAPHVRHLVQTVATRHI